MAGRSVSLNFFGNDKALAKTLEHAGGAVEKLQSSFGKLDSVMGGAGLAGGAAFAAALSEGLDVSAARGKLQADLGLTKADSARVGTVAGQLFANGYGAGMDEVNDAITSVIQNMDGMREASSGALKDTTARAITAASVLKSDVGETTRAVAQIMKTGLARNSEEAFDLLVSGAQHGANAAGDLLDTFSEYSTQFRAVGLSGPKAMGLLSQAVRAGARDVDTAADSIKEFAIRSKDGSDLSRSAFRALNLDADLMFKTFAAGGPGADKAFTLVTSRLKGMKSQTEQNTVATALFGTKSEDLQQALFALNPATAIAELGKFRGATDAAGKAMGDTAAGKFTAFKRSLQTNVVNIIVTDVIPQLERLASVGASTGIGASELVRAGLVVAAVALAFKGLTMAIAATKVVASGVSTAVGIGSTAVSSVTQLARGYRDLNLAYAANATLSTRIGAGLKAQVLLWRQMAAAQGVSTARVIAGAIAQRVAAVATTIWAAAMWAFNAAADANPIGLIIIAVVALVAAIVLAYRNSATFRNIVQATWRGIAAAASWAWNTVIKPIWDALKWYITSVLIPGYQRLWNVVKTVWALIAGAISLYWNGYVKPIFAALANVLGPVMRVAWAVLSNTVKAAWIAIQIYVAVAWAVIKVIFNAVKWYVLNVLVPYFRMIWSVTKVVWAGVSATISTYWNGYVKPVFNAVKWAVLNVLVPYFRMIWSVVKVVWAGLSSTISTVWNSGIKPTFNLLKTGLSVVRSAFSTGVSAIGKIWSGLKDLARTPVNFVIGLYNSGIVGLVNKIASFAGIKTRLDTIPKLASGGTLANPARMAPMMTNGPMAIVGEGNPRWPEYVIPTDPRYGDRARALWASAGRNLAGMRGWMRGPAALGGEGIGFARGGSLQALADGGIIGGFIQGLKDFAFGNVEKAASGVLGRLLGSKVPGSGIFHDAVAAVPKWIGKSILGWIKSKVGMGAGGPGMKGALNWARSQNNKPYIWGGVGPAGYDCSGFMSAITNMIHGKSPYSRLFSTHSFGASGGPGGFARGARSGFMVGVTNAGVGHMAGTLLGVNVESSGSRGVHLGASARGFNDPLFGAQYGLKYDTGGMLAPRSTTLVTNNRRNPEPVFPTLEAAAEYGRSDRDAPLVGELNVNHVPGYSTPDDLLRGLRQAELSIRAHRRG